MRLPFAAILLLGSTPAVADKLATPQPARGAPEEIVCHREAVTGSLAQFRKTCMTRAGWQRQSDNNQAAARKLDEQGLITTCTSPGGCEATIGP